MSHNSKHIFVASTILSLTISPLSCFAASVHEYAPKHDSVHPDFQLETIDLTNNKLQISLWHEHIANREPSEIGVLWSNDSAATLPTLEMETTDYPWATEVYRSKNLGGGVTQNGKTTWTVQSEVNLKNNSSHLLYAYVKFADGGYFNTKVNYHRCYTASPVWAEGMECVPYSYLYVPDNGIEYMARVIKNPLVTDEERAAADTASAEEALREKMAQAQEQLNQAQEKLDSLQQQLGEAYDILAEMKRLYEQTKQEADRAEEAARLAEENSLLSEEYAALAEEARDQAEALKATVERMKSDIEVLETRILELKTEVETARDEALTAADEAKNAADEAKSAADEAKNAVDEAKNTANEVKNAADEARGAVTEVRGMADEMKNATGEMLVAKEEIDSFRVQMEENQESVNNIYNIILNKFQDFESRINNLSKVETIYYGGGSDNWVAQNQQNETKNDTQTLENSDTDETQNVNERLHEYTPTRKEDEQKIEVPKLGIADCSINIWPWIMAGAVLGIAFTSILFMIIERRQDHEETHI